MFLYIAAISVGNPAHLVILVSINTSLPPRLILYNIVEVMNGFLVKLESQKFVSIIIEDIAIIKMHVVSYMPKGEMKICLEWMLVEVDPLILNLYQLYYSKLFKFLYWKCFCKVHIGYSGYLLLLNIAIIIILLWVEMKIYLQIALY